MINEIKKQIYLGSFTSDGEYLEFDLVKSWSEIKELGDIVYFFVSNDIVLKVGKAGGKGGFYSRMSQYKRGPHADHTNRRITRLMAEMSIDVVYIYCVQSPRIKTNTTNMFGDIINIEAPTNVAMESYYMQKLIEDHELAFCYQLS